MAEKTCVAIRRGGVSRYIILLVHPLERAHHRGLMSRRRLAWTLTLRSAPCARLEGCRPVCGLMVRDGACAPPHHEGLTTAPSRTISLSRLRLAVGFRDHEAGERAIRRGPGSGDFRRPRCAQAFLQRPQQGAADHRI